MTTVRTAYLLAVAPALASGCAYGEERRLQRDPFARPSLLEPRERPLATGAPRAAPARAAAAEPKPAFVLNAVLVSGADSLANVNGTVVRVGESVQGYRLVEVHDRSAVFEKNKTRFLLDMPSAQKSPQPFQPRPVPAAIGSDAK